MRAITSIAVAIAARLTASGNQAGVDLLPYRGDYEARLVLNAGATEGADNTLDCKLQHSADNGATDPWADAGVAFAQVTHASASLQVLTINPCDLKRYVRVVDTLGGTSPAVARSVGLVAKLQTV